VGAASAAAAGVALLICWTPTVLLPKNVQRCTISADPLPCRLAAATAER
jgi:hypothetical protein